MGIKKQMIFWSLVLLSVSALLASVYYSGAMAEDLVPVFKVQHRDGYEVTVYHMRNTRQDIEQACGVMTSQHSVKVGWENQKRIAGCVDSLPTRKDPTCYVNAMNPYGIRHDNWLHEVGATPEGNSPVWGHCEGMTHDRESETF